MNEPCRRRAIVAAQEEKRPASQPAPELTRPRGRIPGKLRLSGQEDSRGRD